MHGSWDRLGLGSGWATRRGDANVVVHSQSQSDRSCTTMAYGSLQAHCSVKRGSLRRQMMLNLWRGASRYRRCAQFGPGFIHWHHIGQRPGRGTRNAQFSTRAVQPKASEDQGETLRSMLSQIKEGFRWALMVRFTEADFGLVVHLLGSYLVTAHAVARFAFRCACDSSMGKSPSGTFSCKPVGVHLSL